MKPLKAPPIPVIIVVLIVLLFGISRINPVEMTVIDVLSIVGLGIFIGIVLLFLWRQVKSKKRDAEN